tara:strand:- start:95 stop:322 length:228 start_codon:yes stop_codon:yes gene_type:complete
MWRTFGTLMRMKGRACAGRAKSPTIGECYRSVLSIICSVRKRSMGRMSDHSGLRIELNLTPSPEGFMDCQAKWKK